MMPIERVKFHLKPLVDSMLAQLPDHVFTSDSTTFLDPAFGGGQFLREVVTRLRTAGHSDDNIRSRIYGCEITNFRVKYAQQLGGVISDNLVKGDFLSHDWGTMKFDVIVGNPPYQSTESSGKKLWPFFVETSWQILKPGGYLAMVTPATWVTRPQGRSYKHITQEIFMNNHLTWVNLDAQDQFTIGETVVSWCVHKMESANLGQITQVVRNKQTHQVHYTAQALALDDHERMVASIMQCMDAWSGARLKHITYNDIQGKSIEHYLTTGMLFEKPSPHRVPVFWTAANQHTYYTVKKHQRQGHKVIVNLSGHYYQSEHAHKHMMADTKNQFAIGAGALGIPCDSIKQTKNCLMLLKSKLYQFYVNHEKTSGFNTGIIKLPLLDLNKTHTDQDLYDMFGLTPAQQQFVDENYLKK